MVFQQDGATCHTTRVISRRGGLRDKPLTLDHLKTNNRQVMAEISPNMCQKVVENYLKSINACNTSRGDHLNDGVFRT